MMTESVRTMDQLPENDARALRLLRRLVTLLTLVMIGGIITITALLWMRLNAPAGPAFPETLVLPEGAVPQAVTRGDGFLAVVTEDARIFILDPTGAEVLDEITIRLPD